MTAEQADCVAVAGCCYLKYSKDDETVDMCMAYKNDNENICTKETDGVTIDECECFAEKITAFISAIILLAFVFWVKQITVLNTYFIWIFHIIPRNLNKLISNHKFKNIFPNNHLIKWRKEN